MKKMTMPKKVAVKAPKGSVSAAPAKVKPFSKALKATVKRITKPKKY